MDETKRVVTAEALGGPGRADPAACAALAVRVLGEAAAPLTLSSITLEMGSAKLDAVGTVELSARVDKRTRAVAFTTLEAHCAGALVFTARALFTAGE